MKILGIAIACVLLLSLHESVAQEDPSASNAYQIELFPDRQEMKLSLPSRGDLPVLSYSVARAGGIETIKATSGASQVLITDDGRNTRGYVVHEGIKYSISAARESDHYILAMDSPINSPSLIADDVITDPEVLLNFRDHRETLRSALPSTDHQTPIAKSTNLIQIDIAFFYDVRILDTDGPQSPHTYAQAAIDYMNSAFERHGQPLSARAAYVGPYPGGQFGAGQLTDLLQSAEANAIADAYGADLLHGMYPYRGESYAGIAFLLGRYGVSAYDLGDFSRTVAHEIGHNMGMNHDRANSSGGGPAEINSFNYGITCSGARTIMSYPGFPDLPHFSDPSLNYNGQPCGIAEGSPIAAHNERVIDFSAQTIAAYRETQALTGSVAIAGPETLTLSESDDTYTVEVVRTGDLDTRTFVDIATVSASAAEGEDYLGILETIVFNQGESSKFVNLDIVNDSRYEEAPETFGIVLRYPVGLSLERDYLEVTISDDDPDPGTARFRDSGVSVWEYDGSVVVPVQRIGANDATLIVEYLTSDVTAVSGADYEASTGTLVFEPESTEQQIEIPIFDDDIRQGYNAFRQFDVRLAGENISEPSSFRVSIFNEDIDVGYAAFDTDRVEIDEDAGLLVVRLTRDGGDDGPLTFSVESIDGTARAGSGAEGADYALLGGSVINNPDGPFSRYVSIKIWNDDIHKGDRSFVLRATSSQSNQTDELFVTIIEDDPNRGSVFVDPAQISVHETSGLADISLVRSGGVEGPIEVAYFTQPSTASVGFDFEATAGVVIFGDGETTKTVSVPIVSDIEDEGPEQFLLTILGNYVVSPSSAIVTITDQASSERVFGLSALGQESTAQIPQPDSGGRSSGGGAISGWLLIILTLIKLAHFGGHHVFSPAVATRQRLHKRLNRGTLWGC